MVKARKFILAKHFVGEPKESDFELVEEELPPLKDGEILVEAVWLSVDPYFRLFAKQHPIGTTMMGSQIARIIESHHKDYPVGKLVTGHYGWQEKGIVDVSGEIVVGTHRLTLVPDFKGLPESLALGVLGMPGNTAYFGFLEICQPKAGEVVVVTGAAGAVGSIVGQIAKIKGCKVIGYAGSDDKVKWLTELGFDYAFNYKTEDIAESLKKSAPEGVDCFFDNVGGEINKTIINHMNDFGRVSLCGSISTYNDDVKGPLDPVLQPIILSKKLKIDSFMVNCWDDRWMEGLNQLLKWILEGKIKYRETITEGFENVPRAFIEMLRGKNFGKAVVKV